ncbi:FKBP-type peptidyl-prolyl cis-trans isomerase N-terminal domain-containing protein [bacterium]|nr:FKBP-type peptidyl-prolyl cis-trans isomerase N-terminal domain-containing protein [bacterium]
MNDAAIQLPFLAKKGIERIEFSDDVTSDQFTKGFELALQGEPLPFSPEEIREAFSILQKEITKREVALAEAIEMSQKLFLEVNGK